jgi:hypothetical protein
MQKYQYCFIVFLFISTSTIAQKKIDLYNIRFTENPEVLLKGIRYEKGTAEKVITYELDQKRIRYQDILMEGSVTIRAFNQQVISYQSVTNLTATTNKVIKAVLATYHQPAKKLTTNGNVRAWYWQTPALFIRLMATDVGFHDKRGQQVACTLQIITLKALKSGIEPNLSQIYQVFTSYKI